MERQSLAGLLRENKGPRLHFKEPDPKSRLESHKQAIRHNMLLLCSHYGKVVAMVGVDDLFDADGNRFQDDRQ